MKVQKTYHTPLLNTLRKAFNIALQSREKNQPDVKELYGNYHRQSLERRRFLSNITKAGIAISAAGVLNSCKKVTDIIPPDTSEPPKKNQPSIAIIGAGMAGLNCAWQLKKAGYISTIYEGASRVSGRIFTRNNLLANGIYTELGGEFIDSNHKDMLDLCGEFNLNLLDTAAIGEASFASDSFYINGRCYTEEEVIAAFHPYVQQIRSDINSLPEVMTYDDHDATTMRFDNMSITGYLDSIGMTGFIRKGIEAAYLTEYGLENDVQSSINFLFLFSPNTGKGFHIFGLSDERYKIEGGNQSVTKALHAQVKNNVMLEQKLVRIKEANTGYKLFFSDTNGTTSSVDADIVISAIPFTLLREVHLDISLPEWKTNAINNLGYGTNSKLLLGFNKRIWRNYQHSGSVFTDTVLQTGWDSSRVQPGTSGGYTVYQGGNKGVELGAGTAASQAQQFINQLEGMWPGCANAWNGNVKRMQWPEYPFTKGSYSAYRLGQYTTIRGAEMKNIGNLYFAGEHCSANFQGFMNGAAETGRIAARNVIKAIK